MPGFKVAHLGQPDVLQIHMKPVGGLIKWFKKDRSLRLMKGQYIPGVKNHGPWLAAYFRKE